MVARENPCSFLSAGCWGRSEGALTLRSCFSSCDSHIADRHLSAYSAATRPSGSLAGPLGLLFTACCCTPSQVDSERRRCLPYPIPPARVRPGRAEKPMGGIGKVCARRLHRDLPALTSNMISGPEVETQKRSCSLCTRVTNILPPSHTSHGALSTRSLCYSGCCL